MKFVQLFIIISSFALNLSCQTSSRSVATATLDSLQPGQKLGDFQAESILVDQDKKPFAATFKHEKFGFEVHVMLFDTAPQAAMWFSTPPTSNKGEAHALEHVVLGKGKSGQYLSLLYDMELGEDSAATYADFTYYHFYSQSGLESFFKLFRQNMEMLLIPEFSDEDVRREVFHYGVDTDKQSGQLKLVEKGTVYNEMNGSHGAWDNWYGMLKKIYGDKHYSQYRSGGSPEGLRETTPEDIRKFHQQNYQLNDGFGAILVVSPNTNLSNYLERVSKVFNDVSERVLQEQKNAVGVGPEVIRASASLKPEIYSYAGANETDPASIMFAWKSFENVEYLELFRLGLFLSEFAKGSDSYLHKKMVNSATRDGEYPIDSVWIGTNRDFSRPFLYGTFSGIPVDRLNEKEMIRLRDKVLKEFKNAMAWKDGSAELLEFNERVKASLESLIRQQKGQLDRPPGFGFRGTSDGWKQVFKDLKMKSGFRKSYVEEEEKQFFVNELNSGKNIWKEVIEKFALTETPYINAKKVSPAMLKSVEKDQEKRIATEERQLKKKYKTSDLQKALEGFRKDYDQVTEEIKKASELTQRPKFTSTPPMSYDPDIRYKTVKIWGNVPITVTEFSNTPKVFFGLSNSLKIFAEEEYIYLPLMRRLIDEVGLRENGQVTSYDKMYEEMRKKIFGVSFDYNTYQFEDRENIYEFEVKLSALTDVELRESYNFWQRILKHNDLDVENLPRIRDLIDRSLSSLVKARQGRAEDWLGGLAGSYFSQEDTLPFYINVSASLLHSYYRYRWWLRSAPSEGELKAAKEFVAKIESLLQKVSTKEDLAKKVAALKAVGAVKNIQSEVLARVFELSPNFKEEIRFLTNLMITDWQVKPEAVLAKIREMQSRLLHRQGMTGYLVGNPENISMALKEIEKWKDLFPNIKPKEFAEKKRSTINENVKRRQPDFDESFPRFLGFVHPDSVNGHVIAISKAARYDQATEEEILQGMSVQLLGGGAPHGLFMKTWQEGLAYSNGISMSEYSGRIRYSAERAPNLPALLDFVNRTIDDRDNLQDEYLSEYALAQFFSGSRLLASPGSRGYSVYEIQKTGNTEEKTRRYREKLLKLREKKNLHQLLLERLPEAAHRVTIDRRYLESQKKNESEFFFVGPEKQLSGVDQMLVDRKLTRLYPADFWIR